MKPPPLDLAAVEIEADDPEAVVRFYAERLGLPTRPRSADGRTVEIGTTTLHVRQAASGTAPFYHLAFAVPENRIHAARDWLLGRGVELVEVDGDPVVNFVAWNAHSLYFHDPAGTILELIARHDLPNADDGPFGPSSLLRIDEVALPTDDLPALVEALETRLGARPYGDGSSGFRPVGDVHGLAIVVAQGRPYYPPTGAIAALHPLALTVRGASPAAFGLPGGPYAVTVTTA